MNRCVDCGTKSTGARCLMCRAIAAKAALNRCVDCGDIIPAKRTRCIACHRRFLNQTMVRSGTALSRWVKRCAKERDGYTCLLCGKQDDSIHVHHINYDDQDDRYENLISLCLDCHSHTNTQRSEWIPKLQSILKERYGEMKVCVCKSCGHEKPHKARGLCETCYQQWYRRKNPPDTVSSLRKDLEYARDEARCEVTSVIGELLETYGASCWLEDSTVFLEIQGKTLSRKL